MRAFTYERAESPAEAAGAVASRPGARFIAGGTNLLDLMKLEIETPAHLVDVNRLDLDRIEATKDGGLRIGALVRNTDLASDARIRRDYGLVSRALVAGARGACRALALAPPPAGNQGSLEVLPGGLGCRRRRVEVCWLLASLRAR